MYLPELEQYYEVINSFIMPNGWRCVNRKLVPANPTIYKVGDIVKGKDVYRYDLQRGKLKQALEGLCVRCKSVRYPTLRLLPYQVFF